MNFLPKLTDWKNEVVFYLGVVATIIAELIVLLNDFDLSNLDAWVALVPAVLGIVQRNFAYGPETVKALKKPGN